MPFNPKEIGRYADVATSYITKEDMERLALFAEEGTRLPIIVMEYPEGFWLRVNLAEVLDEDLAEWRKAGLSEALCNLVRAASAENITYLKIDADGGDHDGFPTFDW